MRTARAAHGATANFQCAKVSSRDTFTSYVDRHGSRYRSAYTTAPDAAM
jgi:hypothetical protein